MTGLEHQGIRDLQIKKNKNKKHHQKNFHLQLIDKKKKKKTFFFNFQMFSFTHVDEFRLVTGYHAWLGLGN